MGYTGFMASSISWSISVVAKSPVDWFSVKGHWPGHKCGFTKDCFGDCGSFLYRGGGGGEDCTCPREM